GGVGDAVVPQHVVHGQHPAGAEQPERLLGIQRVVLLVGVDEDQVVGAVGEPGHHLGRAPADDPGALTGDPGGGEGLLRGPLVLRLGVDRGEHAVGGHALEQPQPADPGSGPDLDHVGGAQGRGDEPQGGPDPGEHRGAAQLLTAAPGLLDELGLGEELLGVGPGRDFLAAHGHHPSERTVQATPRFGAHPEVRRHVPDPAGREDEMDRTEDWQTPSWDEVVREHSARVYRLAYRLTGNQHDAEDLTHDVFVRVFRSLHTYRPGTFEGWLHRITTNLFLDRVRRKQRIRFDALSDEAAARLPS